MSRAPHATVGGQAVIEGVMMRAPAGWAVAVRVPSGKIDTDSHQLPRLSSRSRLARIPFTRGVMVLGESLTLGFRALSWSAQKAGEEEDKPITRREIVFSMTIAIVLFSALFIVLPALVGKWVAPGSTIAFNLVEAVIRVGLFVGYIYLIGRSKEIQRVFQYHGAEHKTIHAYEAGDPLSIGIIQRYRPEHPRCGTNFLLIVLLISVVVFTVVGNPGWLWLVVSRVVLIPVIAGVSYEVLKLAGERSSDRLGRSLAAPGLWLQRLTTAEPDDAQVEVAVAGLLAALDDDALDAVKARGPVSPGALRAFEE